MKLTSRQQKAKDYSIRQKYTKDMVQPSNPLFKKYYPKQYAKMEKTREQQDLKAKQEKESKDTYIKQFKNSQHRYAMKNALKLEEAIEEHGRK